jgi:cytochrome c oxidase assembly protein Cox11
MKLRQLTGRQWALGLAALAVGLGAWLVWRFTGPVQVTLAATLVDVPFEVQIIPEAVWAQPGEVISVTYRIRNTALSPLEALGRLDIEPASAGDQVKIYLTQCSGLNAYQASVPIDYNVVFRVQPAGWFGQQALTIRHTFTRANTR